MNGLDSVDRKSKEKTTNNNNVLYMFNFLYVGVDKIALPNKSPPAQLINY